MKTPDLGALAKVLNKEVERMEREAESSTTQWPPESSKQQAREEIANWAKTYEEPPILSNRGVFVTALQDLYERVKDLELQRDYEVRAMRTDADFARKSQKYREDKARYEQQTRA